MDKILHKIILNNTVESYLYVLLVISLALLTKRIISKYLAKLLFKLVGKAGKSVARDSFLNLVVQPLDLFLVLMIGLIAFDGLHFPEALNVKIYRITTRQLLDSLTNGILIIAFIWLCLRLIDFIAMVLEEKANLTADQTDNQLILFFKDFFKAILVIIGILLILRFSFNKDVGNILTGLSIVGAALALATRESLENLIASFIIFFDRPFATGDLVKVNGFTGTIEKIGLRSTRIRTQEKTFITVPNKQMVDTIVDNISLRTQRKGDIKLEVDLGAGSERLHKLLEEIQQLVGAPFSENSLVYLMDTGKNAHVISIEYYTSVQQSFDEFARDKQKIILRIIELLEANQVKLAASSTDVNVHQL
ncbi:MAG: mechanosensitive ion channel [Sphingobacteriia bacterium]|nr:mechanosensitive ion channel [Sphingobacteriia bacterium]